VSEATQHPRLNLQTRNFQKDEVCIQLKTDKWYHENFFEGLHMLLKGEVAQFDWKDVMVDIETLGLSSQAAFVEISLVQFNRFTGESGLFLKVPIRLDSLLKAGLKINGGTVAWWLRQPDTTRLPLSRTLENGLELEDALHLVAVFLNEIGKDAVLWGNGARFDLGILANAFEVSGVPLPWKFFKELDVRTVVEVGYLFGINPKKTLTFEGEPHDSLHDCFHQIKYVSFILRQLKAAGVAFQWTNDQIRELALRNGFKLKPQPDGQEDLNPYVYGFARALRPNGNPE